MRIITQTPRIIIREFLPEEVDVYLKHFTDEEVLRYIPKRTTEERIGIFNMALANYADNGPLKIWGMFHTADGDFIGSCLLRPFYGEAGKTELGYSLEQKYRSQGLATEMAIAMIAHAFADNDTTEVAAVTNLANIGSQRVLEKAGLKRMDNLIKDGEELAYFRLGR